MALKKHLQTRGSNTVKYNYVPKLPTEWILLRQGKNVLIYAHVYEITKKVCESLVVAKVTKHWLTFSSLYQVSLIRLQCHPTEQDLGCLVDWINQQLNKLMLFWINKLSARGELTGQTVIQ